MNPAANCGSQRTHTSGLFGGHHEGAILTGGTLAESPMEHVDDAVEAIFHRLCIRQQDGQGDPSMGLDELRLALGVSEALMNEALWLLTFPGDKRIRYPKPGRVALGPDWLRRCERQPTSG